MAKQGTCHQTEVSLLTYSSSQLHNITFEGNLYFAKIEKKFLLLPEPVQKCKKFTLKLFISSQAVLRKVSHSSECIVIVINLVLTTCCDVKRLSKL